MMPDMHQITHILYVCDGCTSYQMMQELLVQSSTGSLRNPVDTAEDILISEFIRDKFELHRWRHTCGDTVASVNTLTA